MWRVYSYSLCEIPQKYLWTNYYHFLSFFLKDFIYLFLERREGREKKRERNINVWLPLKCPQVGTWPATQACALTGNQTGNPLVHSPVLNPLSHTSQGLLSFSSSKKWSYLPKVTQTVLKVIFYPHLSHVKVHGLIRSTAFVLKELDSFLRLWKSDCPLRVKFKNQQVIHLNWDVATGQSDDS